MSQDFLGYGNHCGLFSEEISAAGEGLGNAVQGFTVSAHSDGQESCC